MLVNSHSGKDETVLIRLVCFSQVVKVENSDFEDRVERAGGHVRDSYGTDELHKRVS